MIHKIKKRSPLPPPPNVASLLSSHLESFSTWYIKLKKRSPLPPPRPFSLSHFRRVHSFKCVREGETKRGTTSGKGAGIAQWLLERRTREWKVAGSNPCRSGGRIFNKRHVIMQTSVTSLCKQDKRHVVIQTSARTPLLTHPTGLVL